MERTSRNGFALYLQGQKKLKKKFRRFFAEDKKGHAFIGLGMASGVAAWITKG